MSMRQQSLFSGIRVHFSCETNEWYSPWEIVSAARDVLGQIDVDPCAETRPLGKTEVCSFCMREGQDRVLCSCREILCEACYDRGHQEHDETHHAEPLPPNVPARQYFVRADNGLSKQWCGTVYMNPPYGRLLPKFVRKLRTEFDAQRATAAVALLPARTDTRWFKELRSAPVCFVEGRLRFSGARNSAPFPSAIFYLGERGDLFRTRFGAFGAIYS